MEITARRAHADDAAAIADLRTMGRAETVQERGGKMLIAHDLELDPERRSASVEIVGLIGEAVVGYGSVRAVSSPRATVAELWALYVHPEARGVGVGAAVVEVAQGWAVAEGCTRFESQALPGNRAAKNFFERLGMVTRKMVVSTSLDSPAEG